MKKFLTVFSAVLIFSGIGVSAANADEAVVDNRNETVSEKSDTIKKHTKKHHRKKNFSNNSSVSSENGENKFSDSKKQHHHRHKKHFPDNQLTEKRGETDAKIEAKRQEIDQKRNEKHQERMNAVSTDEEREKIQKLFENKTEQIEKERRIHDQKIDEHREAVDRNRKDIESNQPDKTAENSAE